MKDGVTATERDGGREREREVQGVRNVLPVQPWQNGDDESRVSIGWSELYNKLLPSCVAIVNDSMKDVWAVILFSVILFQG